ncbi:hypothetical protein EOD39_12300 [Acipenser ruthenus]|uniref:Uncharacterized protein n=1 Tax=Acipenser ruthenus TaxID=7906 RepID=A0A662YSE6_ACIRT|nr:hypothetical protein EOD39_12300 [Acipenser ruthenus]
MTASQGGTKEARPLPGDPALYFWVKAPPAGHWIPPLPPNVKRGQVATAGGRKQSEVKIKMPKAVILHNYYAPIWDPHPSDLEVHHGIPDIWNVQSVGRVNQSMSVALFVP